MFYTLLIITASIFLLTILTSYILIREAVRDKELRKVMLLFALLTPPLTVLVFMRFFFKRPKPVRYSEELGCIEDQIEHERAQTFGGKVLHPSLSERWRLSYLYAVQKAAARLEPQLTSISNPRVYRRPTVV